MLLNILQCVAWPPYREPSASNITNAEVEQFWFKETGNKITHFCLYLKRTPNWGLTWQWIWERKYIVQSRWNILSVIFLPRPFTPQFLSFFPVKNSPLSLKFPSSKPVNPSELKHSWLPAGAQISTCYLSELFLAPPPPPLAHPPGSSTKCLREQVSRKDLLPCCESPGCPHQVRGTVCSSWAQLDWIQLSEKVTSELVSWIAIPDTRGHLVEGVQKDLSEEPIARQNLNRETGWWCLTPGRLFRPEGMTTARALRWQQTLKGQRRERTMRQGWGEYREHPRRWV